MCDVKNEDIKPKKKKLKKVILVIVAFIVAVELIGLLIVQSCDWVSEGDVFHLDRIGGFHFYNAGAGSPVGDADLYEHYIYLGASNIIIFGDGGVKRVSITKLTFNEINVKYDEQVYTLYSER